MIITSMTEIYVSKWKTDTMSHLKKREEYPELKGISIMLPNKVVVAVMAKVMDICALDAKEIKLP